MGTFPTDWLSGCPPLDATDAQGEFFRVVKNNPCTESDFLTQAELGKALSGSQCLRVGLSLSTTYEAAKNTQDKYPHLGELIASGQLRAEHGKIKVGANAHATWWSYTNVVRHSLFSVVDEAP